MSGLLPGWELRGSGYRLRGAGLVFRVRTEGGAWVATEMRERDRLVTRSARHEDKAAAFTGAEGWLAAERERQFQASQLSLLGAEGYDDCDGRPESHSGLFARGGR